MWGSYVEGQIEKAASTPVKAKQRQEENKIRQQVQLKVKQLLSPDEDEETGKPVQKAPQKFRDPADMIMKGGSKS